MPQHRTSTTFRKGDKRKKGRPPGVENKLSAEVKDVLVRAYTEIGGFERFVKWIKSKPEREDTFWSKMWIRLLPMRVNVEKPTNVEYKSLDELRLAFADKGVSLDAIEKLKRLDLKAIERPKDE